MLRSPFFCLLLCAFLLSCKEEITKPVTNESVKKEAVLLRNKGITSFQDKKFNTAFYNFNKSKIAFETIKDSANIVYNLIQMASIQQINGDYYGSKETLTEALPYIKNKNIYSASINNFFGIADKELSLYHDAIYYYKEAIKDCTDEISKQSPLNNIAVVYIQQKEYDKAIHILEFILNKKIIDEDPASKSRVTDNLGFAYFKKGWSKKGLLLMQQSLESKNRIDDPYGYIESNLHLSEYYLKIDVKKSIHYAQYAYQTATKFNSIDERLKALSFLIANGSGTKYAQKYITLNDSIIKIRNNYKNKFAKIKYDSKKEKDENQKLRLEKAENQLSLQEAKYQRIFFIIGITSLCLLLLYLRKFYQNRNRIEKIKTAYDTETRIAKDIHDELANDVFNAITFTQTQPLESDNRKETLIKKLDHIYSRVRGISRENNDIDTETNYSANLKETLSTYNLDTRNVIINSIEKINWNDIDKIKKITIYRILQELMVNMKKHSEASIVVIKFDNSPKKIFIDYTDNGKGCDQNKIIKNGLQNMENRILSTKGTITFETEPDRGFKVKISMPK
ncbi:MULTISPECIES: tetratricopeptide repeat-containing sensor histidine kinase [Flavobacterium]|uniref:histidine kinase n=1 Tax=Flavobacterium salmonis TaxID=2654844 RepID=A0A6V6Z0L1_9FLAO|nr:MULTISPECIES: tetratricopeptide repeat-containing sensor histidine kinase [Flavobacterium]OOV18632.1 ATP-binding protein [Flavobacterium sp. LM4]CAD0005196.1 ATP-binding protein [Flavobacterium salmonis]